MECEYCKKELSESIYSKDKKLKSCPKCSTENGHFHVFKSYPDEFGKTPLRGSSNHPEGPQSYCTSCRGGQDPSGGILCNDVDIESEE